MRSTLKHQLFGDTSAVLWGTGVVRGDSSDQSSSTAQSVAERHGHRRELRNRQGLAHRGEHMSSRAKLIKAVLQSAATWGTRLALLALFTLLAVELSLADGKSHKLS